MDATTFRKELLLPIFSLWSSLFDSFEQLPFLLNESQNDFPSFHSLWHKGYRRLFRLLISQEPLQLDSAVKHGMAAAEKTIPLRGKQPACALMEESHTGGKGTLRGWRVTWLQDAHGARRGSSSPPCPWNWKRGFYSSHPTSLSPAKELSACQVPVLLSPGNY